MSEEKVTDKNFENNLASGISMLRKAVEYGVSKMMLPDTCAAAIVLFYDEASAKIKELESKVEELEDRAWETAMGDDA